MKQPDNALNRRSFLKISTLAGGGLLIGINWMTACQPEGAGAGVDRAAAAAADFVDMNAHIKIADNGWITLMSPNPELGQGVKTSMPLIVAEELDADWDRVLVEQAPLDTDAYERQVAGGSYSIRSTWDALRQAGATVRKMMIDAAAERWEVDAAQCSTDESEVIHPDGEQTIGYGELLSDIANMEVPEEVTLKEPEEYKLLGTWIPSVDSQEIVIGAPIFGSDTRREGMLYAMVVRPPAFGQTLGSVDDSAAKNTPGVKDVVTFDNKVAVLAESTWQAKKGRDALRIQWKNPEKLDNTSEHFERFRELVAQAPDEPKRKNGNAEQALAGAATIIEGVYEAPFLPHNPMEPMNFFAHVREDGVELYGPTQTPARARKDVSDRLGIPEAKIEVMMPNQGGGFGRRLYTDFALDAAVVSQMANAPVNVIWTREDDMTAGIYRPAGLYSYRAGLNEQGELIAWHLRAAAANTGNGTLPNNFPAGAVPNFQVDFHRLDSHVTTGAWRAPNHNFVAYAEESFLDEIAHAAGKDPVQFRLELLDQARNNPTGEVEYDIDRYRKVIERVAEMAGWGKQGENGIYKGIGTHFSYGSYIAQVADVSVENGNIIVHKVYCAVDCGTLINRAGAENQIEGGIMDGLGHAMFAEQILQNGVPQNDNFDSYRLLRMREAPEIEVDFIKNTLRPEGLGEPGLPPTGGAVANAVFEATGKRMRKQPFVSNQLLG